MTRLLATVVALLLATAIPAYTQTVTNPTGVEFNVSANHNDPVSALDPTPLVSGYSFDAVAMNSLGAIYLHVGLGKPTAANGALVTIPVAQLATIEKDLVWTATVSTLWSGAPVVSPPSNPFGIASTTSTAPGAASNVKVKRSS